MEDAIGAAPGTGLQSRQQNAYTNMVNRTIPLMKSNVLQTQDPVQRRNGTFRAFAHLTALAPIYKSGENLPPRKVSSGLFSILATDEAWQTMQEYGITQQEAQTIEYDLPIVAKYEINALATSARKAMTEARAVRIDKTRPLSPIEQAGLNLAVGAAGGRAPVSAETKQSAGEGAVFLTMDGQQNVSFTTTEPSAEEVAAILTAKYGQEFTNIVKVMSRFYTGSPEKYLYMITHQNGFPPAFREPVIETEEKRGPNGSTVTPAKSSAQ